MGESRGHVGCVKMNEFEEVSKVFGRRRFEGDKRKGVKGNRRVGLRDDKLKKELRRNESELY